MRPQSCKAKGRRLQITIATDIRDAFHLQPDDVVSTSMGAQGEDVRLSSAARTRFPYSIECKNSERLNVWSAWNQTIRNAGAYTPLLVLHKNNSDTLCVLPWSAFLTMAHDAWESKAVKRAPELCTGLCTGLCRGLETASASDLSSMLMAIAHRLKFDRDSPAEIGALHAEPKECARIPQPASRTARVVRGTSHPSTHVDEGAF